MYDKGRSDKMMSGVMEMRGFDQQALTVDHITTVLCFNATETDWISARNRSSHYIGYQLTGSFHHKFEKSDLLFSEDTAYFVNKNDHYAVHSLRPGNSIVIHFSCTADVDTESFVFDCKDKPHIKQLFIKIYHEWLRKDTSYRFRCFSMLYDICAVMTAISNPVYTDKAGASKVRKAYEYLKTHCNDPELSVGQLAGIAGISVRHFDHLFKQIYFLTPNQCITSLRINLAKELLKTGNYSVCKIAQITGFSDVYYFSKVFKQKTGSCPSRYAQADL